MKCPRPQFKCHSKSFKVHHEFKDEDVPRSWMICSECGYHFNWWFDLNKARRFYKKLGIVNWEEYL